jgi:hypothetical protein
LSSSMEYQNWADVLYRQNLVETLPTTGCLRWNLIIDRRFVVFSVEVPHAQSPGHLREAVSRPEARSNLGLISPTQPACRFLADGLVGL